MSEGMNAEELKRLGELENQVRVNIEKLTDMEDAVEAMYAGILNLEKSLKGLFLSSISSQIMEETITRYLAGYEKGDYIKEIEMAQNGDAKAPSEFRLLIKDKGFDQVRFNELAEEVGKLMIEMRAKAAQQSAQKSAAASSKIVGLDGKPMTGQKPNLTVL